MQKNWLFLTFVTTLLWGVWGALIEIPEKSGFPATLGYVVWALTMVPCSLVVMSLFKGKRNADLTSIVLGLSIGLSGAGGQLLLFLALKDGPAYIVFPLVSLFPVVTILLSVKFLGESATRKHWIGIALALIAILLLSYHEKGPDQDDMGILWAVFATAVFLMWGIQAFLVKFSHEKMTSETIFFYMTLSAVALIPVAVFMTDFEQEINWSFTGPGLAGLIQVMNSIGALTLVYALRSGRAIVVVPTTSLAPVITIVLSLALYSVIPNTIIASGLITAVVAMYLIVT